ncbi:MAG: hypothetical protein GY810_25055 [Aureispira sp.]|nr:hypothetical protein [Aureispira sp.]
MFRNKFLNGFIPGVILPMLGYFLFIYLNDVLIDNGAFSNSMVIWAGFKERTLVIMAICLNLIPTFVANRKYMEEFVRGIMVPTVLYCFVWFYVYSDQIGVF